MRERELIEALIRAHGSDAAGVAAVGMGDDAAVVRLPGGLQVVLTADMLIEGVHFESGTDPRAVGYKAVARALSDLAAMAARPLCTAVALSVPPGRWAQAAKEVLDAAARAALQFGAPLVGGDTAGAQGPAYLCVTALGVPGPAGPVLRSGARPGDTICVTGRLGGSILGRHLSFVPRITEALELARRVEVHALIDISDGLSTDLNHLARASGVAMVVEALKVPVAADAEVLSGRDGRPALEHALHDGEDYELLFCVPPGDGQALVREGLCGVPVSAIGHVEAGEGCFVVDRDGARRRLEPGGWEHL